MRVHYRQDGSREATSVVLANSLGTTTAMWARQVSDLAARHRVVRYDLRGHGGSPMTDGPVDIDDLGRDLIDLLDDLAIDRAALVGLSLGGMVSMWVAAHAPERVERLVLCASSARLGPPEAWHNRAATVHEGGTAAIADMVVGRWFTPAFAAAHPAVVDEARSMLASSSRAGYAACCEAIARMDLVPDLGRITAPTLVISGAQDPAIPADHADVIADAIASARTVVVPAAHLLNVERSAEVTALIVAHLAGS